MPAGSVEYDYGVGALGDLAADLLEMQVHGPGLGLGNDPGGAGSAGRTNGPEQIGRDVALIAGRARAAAALGPDTGERALLADAGLVLLGWTAPDGIDCARMRSLQISDRRDRPWNRLAELAWIRRSIFSNFTG